MIGTSKTYLFGKRNLVGEFTGVATVRRFSTKIIKFDDSVCPVCDAAPVSNRRQTFRERLVPSYGRLEQRHIAEEQNQQVHLSDILKTRTVQISYKQILL